MKLENPNRPELYGFLSSNVDGMDILAGLALDLRWSWDHAADELWQNLDEELWELTHNPWVVLQAVSGEQLEKQLKDPDFVKKMEELLKHKESNSSHPSWFHENHQNSKLNCVAYFSMEFMLSEALPIYVGGLGNVAGDQLKAASDLGVPVIAIGLLFQQGYFRQEFDINGTQQALFPFNDPSQLPIKPLRLEDGKWLRLKISLAGYPVWLRTWEVQVGRTKLLLLDSNDPANLPTHRSITSELYGGGDEMRIQQEIILGIGGWKLLEAMGIKPAVCHMNEGHAAFLILERACNFMKQNGTSFEVALAVTRAGNLFTTHTAVAAGFDHFEADLMRQYFEEYAKNELKISLEDLLALGRQDPYNSQERFNMAFLAIRGSGAVNGVSRLHGVVSRHLFESIFPRWPKEEIPVGHVTNGVHMPSWDSEFADKLWTNACGKDRWKWGLETIEQDLFRVPDDTLWELRNNCRNKLVEYTRKKLERQFLVSGQPPEILEAAKKLFDPDTLTLGFARRFVAYKRPNLILYDEERFIRILTNPQQPVQLVIAGKAPPYDQHGIDLIRQWMQFIQKHNLYKHIAFLGDHDMLLAEQLVQGADVWINTPRRPWEACGTSGMKVLVNGGINLSELDGWWAEAYDPKVGWALGDTQEHGDNPAWDAIEAEALYDLLEKKIIPEFYNRNENGIPVLWVERMRNSMAKLTPQYSANRTVREYTERYYLPAAANYEKRASGKGAEGIKIVNWKQVLKNNWDGIKFGELQIQKADSGYNFLISVMLNGINPATVLVELYAEGINGSAPERIRMEPVSPVGNNFESHFMTQSGLIRAAGDYTVRIIPDCNGISVPLEENLILWQR
jgi:glycogen phosphorylase